MGQRNIVEFSVVLPAYNEANRLENAVAKVMKALEEIAHSYEIIIGQNLINEIAIYLKKTKLGRSLIITDSNVKKYFGLDFVKTLKTQGLIVDLISFKAGEENKTRET